jgi:hypothetical protein
VSARDLPAQNCPAILKAASEVDTELANRLTDSADKPQLGFVASEDDTVEHLG